MPYYQGMGRPQGDPGFFSSIGRIVGTVARAFPGPIGAIAGLVSQPPTRPPGPRFAAPQRRVPVPGVVGAAQRMVPGGQTGFVECPPTKRRRKIDPLNIKALRRANTRQRSFLRAVDRTLKTMPTKAGVTKRRKQISGATK